MVTRTNTSHLASFTRPPPSAVTYHLPSDPPSATSAKHVVTITLPAGSTWSSGLHWHETHTEFLKVLRGTALVTLDGVTARFDSSSGIITVPRYARHEWHRADIDGEDLIVEEWTSPSDGLKEVFFRNLNSLILDYTRPPTPPSQLGEVFLFLELHSLFRQVDNWPSFYSFAYFPNVTGKWLEWGLSHLVLFLAYLLGKMVGVRGVYEEYVSTR